MEEYLHNLFRSDDVVQRENTEFKIIDNTKQVLKQLNKSVRTRKGKEVTEREIMNLFNNKQAGGGESLDSLQIADVTNNFCRNNASQCGDSFKTCGQTGGNIDNYYNEVLEKTLKRSKRFKISKRNKDLLKYIVHERVMN
tara:strand:- start:6575 stop:6994 length:420 start_codon:yes stop_codon:yes gene_type:complete